MKWDVEQATLEDSQRFENINGLWTGKKAPFVEVGVIRNTNFTESGRIDYSNVARLQVEQKKLEKRQLRMGDIIVERSGGGPKQPVGRVVYFEREDGPFSFSNFTSAIRVRDRNVFDSKFVFYRLLELYQSGRTEDIQRRTTGLRNLDFSAYKERACFPLIPLSEQYKIAGVLGVVQQAIEQQERLIALTTELKKALLHKLFTQGLRGETQKQTEIGPLPESYEVVRISDLFKFSSGKKRPGDTEAEWSASKPFPVYGGNGILGYSSEFLLESPVLVLGRVGEYCGCAHHTQGKAWISDNALYPKKTSPRINTRWAAEYLTYANLNQYSSRAGQPLITQGVIGEVKMPLPLIGEQDEMTTAFSELNRKLDVHRRKHGTLTDLFRTLLHQLMTAQIRVHDLDLDGILSQVVRENGDKQSPGLQSPLDK